MKTFFSKPEAIKAVQLKASAFDLPHPNDEHVPGVHYNGNDRVAFLPSGEVVRIGDWILKVSERHENDDGLRCMSHFMFEKLYHQPELEKTRMGAILEALGTASLCWEPRPSSNVFCAEEAEEVAKKLYVTLFNEPDVDGMLAHARALKHQAFPCTVDAKVWAAEFERICQNSITIPELKGRPDEHGMLGWFANAIMAGYDCATMRNAHALDTFQKDCLRTENKDFDSCYQRLTGPMLNRIFFLLSQLIDVSFRLDEVKKHVFYGKALTNEYNLPDCNYVLEAGKRLTNTNLLRLLHSILGTATESGELAEKFKDWAYRGIEPTQEALTKELMDPVWYAMQGLSANDTTFHNAAHALIEKLRKRYPEKFTEQAAKTHDGQ